MARGGQLVGLICLVLGVADLGLLNLVVVPAAWSGPAGTSSREPLATGGGRPPRPTAVTRVATAPDAAPTAAPRSSAGDAGVRPPALPTGLPELPTGRPDLVISFSTNTVALRAEEGARLAQLVARLRREPELNVLVTGHTDQRGDPELNQRISLSRARRVTELIVAGGVPYQRITTRGYGELRPLGPGIPGTWVRSRRVAIYLTRQEQR